MAANLINKLREEYYDFYMGGSGDEIQNANSLVSYAREMLDKHDPCEKETKTCCIWHVSAHAIEWACKI